MDLNLHYSALFHICALFHHIIIALMPTNRPIILIYYLSYRPYLMGGVVYLIDDHFTHIENQKKEL